MWFVIKVKNFDSLADFIILYTVRERMHSHVHANARSYMYKEECQYDSKMGRKVIKHAVVWQTAWLDLPPKAATQCVGGGTTAKTQVSQNYETFDMVTNTDTNTNTITNTGRRG